MSFSIIYCTNNVLSKDLLSHTLVETHRHTLNNDSELIIASHYPLMKNYEIMNGATFNNDTILKDKIIKLDLELENSRNLVFGKLHYSLKTIWIQMRDAIEKAKFDNILIMEHDCLYPDNYVQIMSDCLKLKDFAYISNAKIFLNFKGYFRVDNQITMSNVAWKKSLALEILNKKIELMDRDIFESFEPLIFKNEDIERKPLLKVILQKMKDDPDRDIPITDSICADEIFIKDNNEMMDIKHGYNYCGYCYVNDKKENELYFYDHPLWGSCEKYKTLFVSNEINELIRLDGIKMIES